MKTKYCDASPISPVGDSYSLDDEDSNLAEKHKEEEKKAERAVGPERKTKQNQISHLMNFSMGLLQTHNLICNLLKSKISPCSNS